MLPEVRDRLAELQAANKQLEDLSSQLKEAASTNGGTAKPGWKEATDKAAVLLEWFNDRDIVVRDIAQGLIDFPGVLNGEDILLCWKSPEPLVAFWHYPDAGFAGRQPL